MTLELVSDDDEKNQNSLAERSQPEAAPVYAGPERRKQQRRHGVDRREMMRFEAKSGRRSGNERRKHTDLWKHHDF